MATISLLDAVVEVGTPVDFIVAPAGSDAHDTTSFTALIESSM